MKNYYLIPIHDKIVFLNGNSLESILEKFYPELYQREKERVKLFIFS